MTVSVTTTPEFEYNVDSYLTELAAKRKEILDARKDTADFELPTREDIIDDVINGVGVDDDGEYYNNWGVTDSYDSDYPFTCHAIFDDYGNIVGLDA